MSKVIYIDYLCFESLYTLIKGGYRGCQVSYCQKSIVLPVFVIKAVGKLIKSDIKILRNIPQSETFVDGVNLYEKTHTELTKIVNNWANNDLSTDSLFTSLIEDMSYNKYKLRAYVENVVYKSLHRSYEVITLAGLLSQGDAHVILKRQYLSHLLDIKGIEKLILYQGRFSKFFSLERRKDYIYDNVSFADAGSPGNLRYLYYFFKTVLLFFQRNGAQQYSSILGVDQYQTMLRERGANDLFWFDSQLVQSKNVLYLAHADIDDISLEFLKKRGIELVRINPSIRKILRSLTSNGKGGRFLSPSFNFYRDILKSSFRKLKPASDRNKLWLFQLLRNYTYRELYWRDIYKQLNIKLLWSMADACRDSLVRAQSIEQNAGLFLGSNYSFYQFEMLYTQKMYDIYFSWGRYFSKEIMRRNYNPESSIYIEVGYAPDSHFKAAADRAKEIKKENYGQYIVSYIDNNTGYDIELSKDMGLQMAEMFLHLLDKYGHMTLLLKPKRQYEVDILVQNIPRFGKYIESGRVKVFVGKEHGERFPPSVVGGASDLVVCLGINTAGIECFLSGSDVIYVNLPKYQSSPFYKEGVGRNIYNSIHEALPVIDRKIANRVVARRSHDDSDVYQSIDHFQDQSAHMRVGSSMKTIVNIMSKGRLSHSNALKAIRDALPEDQVFNL